MDTGPRGKEAGLVSKDSTSQHHKSTLGRESDPADDRASPKEKVEPMICARCLI